MLVLEELKKKYISMRTKIKMGIPLDALPPLSVEMNLFPVSFSYVPSKLFRKELCHDSVSGTSEAEVKAPELQGKKISVNVDDPRVVCVTAGGQPGDSISSKTFKEQYKEENVEHGCVKNEEGNEDWFDAKEELSVAAFSVVSEETKKQQEKQDTVDSGEAKIMESGSVCSFVRVGGLSTSVSEDDLRSRFQKYQIADTIISVNSSNCRHVFLSFKDTSKAKLAVEEMNQKKIKGKPLSVELVNISLENKRFVPQVLANKLWHEIQTVDKSQRNYQSKTVASASKSVKGPDATFASEKTHLLPITSSEISCFTQVPSDTKCPDWKSFTEDKDTGENSLQKTTVPLSTNSHDAFIPPNMLNLSNFTKLMKKLQKLHPEASRDRIVDALLEVRKNNKGILSGLSISSIMERTSVILEKSTPS
ncbi:RNA-binding protein 44 [Heliangelus exortis]